LLTHKDDIADHELFKERFDCTRIMHAEDGARRLRIERVLEGQEPLEIDNDIIAIPTPGHTRGHVFYLLPS
jgi:glyoxylase-like metal-dependent hydrolase (beta-lactamase superfamily II)